MDTHLLPARAHLLSRAPASSRESGAVWCPHPARPGNPSPRPLAQSPRSGLPALLHRPRSSLSRRAASPAPACRSLARTASGSNFTLPHCRAPHLNPALRSPYPRRERPFVSPAGCASLRAPPPPSPAGSLARRSRGPAGSGCAAQRLSATRSPAGLSLALHPSPALPRSPSPSVVGADVGKGAVARLSAAVTGARHGSAQLAAETAATASPAAAAEHLGTTSEGEVRLSTRVMKVVS